MAKRSGESASSQISAKKSTRRSSSSTTSTTTQQVLPLDMDSSNTSSDIDMETANYSSSQDGTLSLAHSSHSQNNYLVAVRDSTASVKDGIDLLKSLLADYRISLESAPPDEKREGLRTLVTCDTSVHLSKAICNATEAFKQITSQTSPSDYATVAAASASNPVTTINATATTATRVTSSTVYDQSYEIRLIAKPNMITEDMNVKSIFIDALRGTPMSVQKYDVRGNDGHFKVPTESHVNRALAALAKATYNNNSLSTYYDISSSIISQNAIKLMKIPTTILKKEIPWINADLELDVPTAKNILANSNDITFDAPSDIVYIQLNSLPDNHHIVTIHVTSNCFDRLLIAGRRNFRMDLGGYTASAYPSVQPAVCLKCLEFGHFLPACTNSSRCKFDGNRHPSGECRTPTSPSCFRCSAYNRKHPATLRPTDHNALHHLCPVIKAETENAWTHRRDKALQHHNGV